MRHRQFFANFGRLCRILDKNYRTAFFYFIKLSSWHLKKTVNAISITQRNIIFENCRVALRERCAQQSFVPNQARFKWEFQFDLVFSFWRHGKIEKAVRIGFSRKSFAVAFDCYFDGLVKINAILRWRNNLSWNSGGGFSGDDAFQRFKFFVSSSYWHIYSFAGRYQAERVVLA